jgi:hypothetical protein
MHDSVRHPPAVDAMGAVEESGRAQFEAEALKLGDEGVNVKFGHGEERTARRQKHAGRIVAPRIVGGGELGAEKKPRELFTGQVYEDTSRRTRTT